MDRMRLARECVIIERSGGSVLDYLKGMGCVSPWGTWHRLQKEELKRQDWQITDGKEDKSMKLTLEQKKKAVQIAVDGGNPLPYLKELGMKNPSGVWFGIKKRLETADPETFAKLPARANAAKPVTTCCAPAPESGVEVPDELPEDITMPISKATISEDTVPEITKTSGYDEFEVTGLRTAYGEFHISNNGYLFFGANPSDELEMPVEIWRRFAEDLPKIMRILGIE